MHRYQRNSEACEKLAQSLHHLTTVEERGLFDFGARGQEASPLVLILDRKDDPVTPLLLQWTYQAMVHELIGLETNRVDLSHIPGVSHLPSSICCTSKSQAVATTIGYIVCAIRPRITDACLCYES